MVTDVHFMVQKGSFGQIQPRKPSENTLLSGSLYRVFIMAVRRSAGSGSSACGYKGMTVSERPAIGIRMPEFMSGRKRKADDGRKHVRLQTPETSEAWNGRGTAMKRNMQTDF